MAAIICKTISKPLNLICSNITNNPFCLYVSTSTILNISPIISTLVLIQSYDNENAKHCKEQHRIQKWLYINSFLCFMNILSSWYFAYKVLKPSAQESQSSLYGRRNAFRHAIHLLCYDTYMAVFILTYSFFFYWQWIGFIWFIQDKVHDDNCNEDDTMYIKHLFTSSLFFGWTFIFFGSCTFCCSLFCSTFYDCEEVMIESGDYANVGIDDNNTNDRNDSDVIAVSLSSRKDEPLLSEQDLYSSIPIAEEVTAIPVVPYNNPSSNNLLQQQGMSESSIILPAVVIPCPDK